MTKKRSRMTLLACAGIASIGLMVGASPAAAKTKTKVLNTCVNEAVAIPDPDNNLPAGSATAVIPVNVPKFKGKPQNGVVTALTSTSTRISHTDNGDLVLQLITPGNRVITLSNTRDDNSSGDGYGTGAASCSGSLVFFGDAFPTSITTPGNTTANSPITGSFRPETPLAAAVGGAAKGNWTLVVTDTAGVDTGSINAFGLNLTYKYKVKPKKKK